MNYAETESFLEKIQGCYPRISVKDTTIKTWQEILKYIPYETCNKAYIKYLKSGESREPKPGDILSIGTNIFRLKESNPLKCKYCKGRGIIILIDELGHESIARCWCKNGEHQPYFAKVKLDFIRIDSTGRIAFFND